ncbi:MAG: hypothetical protein WD097_04560 [Balneolales bacterium]
MTYQDQHYYKEFRNLLNKLQSAVSKLKADNKTLRNENLTLSHELREVRTQLANSQKEAERLLSQVQQLESLQTQPAPVTHETEEPADIPGKSVTSTLFDQLSDNEKITLRQKITELIGRIDKHLANTNKL